MPESISVSSPESTERWQGNPMVWLVIAIPALTVAGCLLTVFLALTHPDEIEATAPSVPTHDSVRTSVQ